MMVEFLGDLAFIIARGIFSFVGVTPGLNGASVSATESA